MSGFAVYRRELSAALDCPDELRRELLGRMERMAEDFRAGKPETSWDDVRDFLGEPQESARMMLENANQDKLARYRSTTARPSRP